MNLTDYDYSPTKLNALVSVEDLNGIIANVEQDIVYNALHQPSSISEGNYELELEYGADGQRISSKLKETESLKRTRHYLPNFEKQVFTDNNKEQQIHYIAGGDGLAAIYVIEDGVGSMYYTYTDYLGSILKVTDNIGNLVAEQSFDAWGRKRNAANWTYSTIAAVPDWLYRGYTGHEHYEEFALINMNGRMYDPLLGRMLSVDNYVQDNTTQNYNRYTYALNNPLKYTDPSGEFLLGIAAFIVVGSADMLTGNWRGWGGSGKPAVMAGIASGIGGIGAPTPSGLGLLKFSGTQLINKYSPSASIRVNDNLSFNFSLGATYGTEQIGASIFGSATLSVGDFSITGGAGLRGFSKNFGPGGSSLEGIGHYGVSYVGLNIDRTSFFSYGTSNPYSLW